MAARSPLEKRIRRRVSGRDHLFFAVCPPGLKNLCAKELQALETSHARAGIQPGGIEFSSRTDQAMHANLTLRTPVRILMRLGSFTARSFSALEQKIQAIDWEVFLPENSNVRIDVTTRKSKLFHSDAIAQRVSQSIARHLADHFEPSLKPAAGHTLFVRAENDRFTLSLDTTGMPLYKRGLKKKVTQAPLRENIASALLAWAGYGPDDILVDPMTGSGTFSLEAAMIRSGAPPGFFRSFAFEQLPGYSRKTFSYLKRQAEDAFKLESGPRIFASDIHADAIAVINENIPEHPLFESIQVEQGDFFAIRPDRISSAERGILVLNPPYGQRLVQERGRQAFYSELNRKLNADFKGWRLAILLPSRRDYDLLGLKLSVRRVFHGGMEAAACIGQI